jgi:hypothetical protein
MKNFGCGLSLLRRFFWAHIVFCGGNFVRVGNTDVLINKQELRLVVKSPGLSCSMPTDVPVPFQVVDVAKASVHCLITSHKKVNICALKIIYKKQYMVLLRGIHVQLTCIQRFQLLFLFLNIEISQGKCAH